MNTNASQFARTTLSLVSSSLVLHEGWEYALAPSQDELRLAVLAPSASPGLDAFEGDSSPSGGHTLLLGPRSHRNAAVLRARLPWLQPVPLGLHTSAGLGDRIGLATPGHVRAVKAAGAGIAPIFSQQSMREMMRSARTPRQVMDDATWGVFQEGWGAALGADADHLKTTEDIDACLAEGFTFFTIDPGDHVDNRAETASLADLHALAEVLPAEIHPSSLGLAGKTLNVEDLVLPVSELLLYRAAVKYGRAVQHVAEMYRHLAARAGTRPFELEVSVDETEQPTTHIEHVYVALALKRMGVQWVSLAPRYIGRFEKGVDYIGDLAAFEHSLAGHAAIARQYGPYKLSIHSGSDKFSIYPAFMRATAGLVHLKTAGTSYLEALRTIAEADPDLFLEIYAFARSRYETDRKTYHVSADVARTPAPEAVGDWNALFASFDAREVLHVTFGSVLTEQTASGQPRFLPRFLAALRSHPERYAAHLQAHFTRHLAPFAA